MLLEPLSFTPRAGLPPASPCASPMLAVRRTPRPYPLADFARASPLMDSDLARQSPGVPLTLALRLHDGRGQAVQRAAVYVWHYDPCGWTLDSDGDDLRTVALMRGLQLSDAQGGLCFRTVYPGRYEDDSVPVCLCIYFDDGRHVLARADGCLLLPAQDGRVGADLDGVFSTH